MRTTDITANKFYGCLVPSDARGDTDDPIEPVLVLEVSRWSGGRGRILIARRKPGVELYDRGFIDLPAAFRAIPQVFQRYGTAEWNDPPWHPRRQPEAVMRTALHYVREDHGLTAEEDESRAVWFLNRQTTRFRHCIEAAHTTVVDPRRITGLWPVQLHDLEGQAPT